MNKTKDKDIGSMKQNDKTKDTKQWNQVYRSMRPINKVLISSL